MMKESMRLLIVAMLAAAPAVASAAKKEAEPKYKVNLKALAALAELPRDVDVAVRKGASEDEVGKSLRKMKEEKVDGEAAVEVARHFKKQADEKTSDRGLSDVVHACLTQGKKGTDLVACVHDDWEKKPKVKKNEEGQPGEPGKPEGEAAPGEGKGPEGKGPEGKGPEGKGPEGKGAISDQGKPEDKAEGKGKPEDKGGPEGKGRPEGKGKMEGKGGH